MLQIKTSKKQLFQSITRFKCAIFIQISCKIFNRTFSHSPIFWGWGGDENAIWEKNDNPNNDYILSFKIFMMFIRSQGLYRDLIGLH